MPELSDSPVAEAHRLLVEAVDALAAAADTGADDTELLSALTVCEGLTRRLDWLTVTAISTLQRRGAFAERGYKSPRLSPEALRLLACDAAVVPIVMNGAGQPLDVGRARRTIPDGLRRAVAARDRGCARCGRPPAWCEVHHITEWECGGETKLDNCVMLCRACHRLIHFTDWMVRLRDGLPEFIPPAWIDPDRHPRRRPLPHLIPA